MRSWVVLIGLGFFIFYRLVGLGLFGGFLRNFGCGFVLIWLVLSRIEESFRFFRYESWELLKKVCFDIKKLVIMDVIGRGIGEK